MGLEKMMAEERKEEPCMEPLVEDTGRLDHRMGAAETVGNILVEDTDQTALAGTADRLRLAGRRMGLVVERKESLPSSVSIKKNVGIKMELTNGGLCAGAGLKLAGAPTPGVLPPLLPPAAASSAFLALCSARRFFSSAGDSNFGFLETLFPPCPPWPWFPDAARRFSSAW